MSEMFGAPVGIRIAEQDEQAKQLNALAMAEGSVKLQSAQMTMDSQKAIMQAMQEQNLGQTAPGDSFNYDKAASLQKLATVAFKTGNIEAGRELMKTSSDIQKNTSTIQKEQLDGSIKKLTLFSSLLDGVHDQASWQQANAMYEMQMKEKNEFAQQPYSPQIVQSLKSASQTALQKAQTEASKAAARSSDASAANSRALVPLHQAQTEEVQVRTTNLRKVGGANVMPKKSTMDMIADYIKTDFGGDVTKESAAAAALPIAEETERLVRDNHRTWAQASREAYEQAKQGGGVEAGLTKKAAKMTVSERAVGEAKDKALLLIDDLINIAEQTKTDKVGVTGLSGRLARPLETVGNITGKSSKTTAHDFSSKLDELHFLLPNALGVKNKAPKDEQARIIGMARGKSLGDTNENVISSLSQLKESIKGYRDPAMTEGAAGEEEVPAAKAGEPQKGVQYTDKNGTVAIYLGDGKWQRL